MSVSENAILSAWERIKDFIHHTPVLTSDSLDKIFGCKLFFKCENFQKAGSFKSRGVANTLLQLGKDKLRTGVATHSSGNHAQALARVASLLEIPSFIVMPENSSKVKVDAVKEYGGTIFFCKSTLEQREIVLKEVINNTGAIEIHPYNNEMIIEGQATTAYELLRQVPELEVIISPVGGGGILSGTALSAHYFGKHVHVFGAEPVNVNDAYNSFHSGNICPVPQSYTIADGLRTSLGTVTFPIIQKHVTDILTVSEGSILEMLRLIWLRMKILIEPSAAVALAVVYEYPQLFRNKNVGLILTGGNIDIDSLPWENQQM